MKTYRVLTYLLQNKTKLNDGAGKGFIRGHVPLNTDDNIVMIQFKLFDEQPNFLSAIIWFTQFSNRKPGFMEDRKSVV